MHLRAPKILVTAFNLYILELDSENHSFDKEKRRGEIFSIAKDYWGDKLIYAESYAASYFFQIENENGVVVTWETHLNEDNREELSNFNYLKYSSMFNNIQVGDEVLMPVPNPDYGDSWMVGGFTATVSSVQNDFITVKDQSDDSFGVEKERVFKI